MGRAPCCDKANVKKGPWSPEEDATLKAYIEEHGTGGNWIALPQKIGLKRCGKSCRLRWLNYLRPNIKHGGFSEEEDNIICNLYISIGSRWSIIAAQLPGRTDNDIKNYWNTRLKKKLLGRRKQSNRGSQDLKDAASGEAHQALSSSALERLQLHMQLQSLQNPFSFYNNPSPWPKLHPFQEKMIQTVQSMNDQNSNNPMMMQQLADLQGQKVNGGQNVYAQSTTSACCLTFQEQYAKLCVNPKIDELENAMNNIGMSSSFISTSNPVESTIVVAKAANGTEQQQQQQIDSSFQAQLIGGGMHMINNSNSSSVGLASPPQEDDQMAQFMEMNVSKLDSFMWWANDFDNKSASSNSWDSTSVLQSQGVFQDYDLGYNM